MTPFERMSQELVDLANPAGMSTGVLLQLSEPLRSTLKHIMRQGSVTFPELSSDLGLPMDETEQIADLLVRCGFLKTSEVSATGEVVYSIRHDKGRRLDKPAALWDRLLPGDGDPEDGTA